MFGPLTLLSLSSLPALLSQWGLTGVCPGPLIVGAVADFNTLASTAITGGPLLMLCFVFIGTAAAQQVSKNMCPAVKPVANASVETLTNAILDSNAIVLDVRPADEREVSHAAPFEGMYECYDVVSANPVATSLVAPSQTSAFGN